MLRLYGEPRSRAFRCIWMLEEMGVDYEVIPTRWASGETREPAFLAINPNGKIPLLMDDERTVWESLAINLYLARMFEGVMKPDSAEAIGLAYRWSFWAMGEFEGPIDAVARYGTQLPDGRARPPLSVLDGALADSEWLAGEAFGVADLNVAGVMLILQMIQFDLSGFSHITDWTARCYDRDALKKAQALS